MPAKKNPPGKKAAAAPKPKANKTPAPAKKASTKAKVATASKVAARGKAAPPKTAAAKSKPSATKKAAAKKPISKPKSPAATKAPAAKKVAKKPVPAKAPKGAPTKKPAAKAPSKSSVKSKSPTKPAKTTPPKANASKPATKKGAPRKAEAKKPDSPKKPTSAKSVPAPKPAKPEKPAAAPAVKKKKKSTSTPLATPSAAISKVPLGKMPRRMEQEEESDFIPEPAKGPVKMTPFLKKQKQRLQDLRDAYLNIIEGVANETIRQRPEDGAGSAFGMHQADAGSDAYDRDFALSLLGKEQDALYEINEALKRIETGVYGICEMSGEKISHERLEALPFTRYTVACQEKIERGQMGGSRWSGSRPQRSVFGLDDASTTSADTNDDDEGDSLDKRGD